MILFVSDNSTNGFAPRGERLWGIGTFGTNISNVRVYFSRWNSDISMEQSYIQNEIWSIALTASGNFTGVPRLEISLPLLPVFKVSNPVSDIEFTSEGDMLLGERSMFGDMGDCLGGGVFAHAARILEFTRQTNGLYNDYSYMVVKIGEYFDGYNNSSGGVDYSYGQYDPINNVNSLCNNMIAGTGDALLYNKTANFYIYGVQTTFRPKAGAVNSKDYSHYIDLNGNTNQTDKSTPGDIDVYRIDSCNSSHGVLDSNGGSGIGSNNNIDTCKYYFANSQAPPGIYPSRPLNYWNYETANRMKLIQNGVNIAGANLFCGMDDGYFRLRLKDIQALSGSDTNKKLKLCGTCYDSIFISTNGIIGFTEHPSPGIPNQNWLDWPGNYVNSFQYGNYDIAAIYPFWLDFDFSKPDSTGGINGISCEVINNQLQIYYSRAKL
ncbi:MAG: hypothetical protein LH629_00815, partial [Ignavibacteria bacterium]|nr:hypothetical protein [Ignavibacteria bacterium]